MLLYLKQFTIESKEDGMEITFKAISIWNTAVLERLNVGSNFNNPYVVVILNMCQEYTLPPHLPSKYLSEKVRKPKQCTIQPVEVLVSSFIHVHVSEQLHVKNWWGINLAVGVKIVKLPNWISPPIVSFIWYCKGWELKFGHRKFTVDIATVPYACSKITCFEFAHRWLMRNTKYCTL